MGETISRSHEELLRRLTLADARHMETLDDRHRWNGVGSTLDPRTRALVQLGALIALDAASSSYQCSIDAAVAAGATPDEVVEVLLAVAPLVGLARVTSAAPRLALSVGYDVDAALEHLDTEDVSLRS